MEEFVANYGTSDEVIPNVGGNLGSNQVPTGGYMGCNNDLAHNYNDLTYNANEYFQTGDVATKYCISRYGARDLIGNYGEFFDGYYENLTSNTTRQKSVYWGTADRITTVISDAVLGYAFPVATTSFYIVDWDYQNLLPKPPYSYPGGSNRKYFSDYFATDFSSTTRVAGHLFYGYTGWGSLSGRFEKALYYAITQVSASWAPRCAIVSP